MHLPRSNCVSWSCVARNPPPERSNPLRGENLKYQVRELRRNFLRSYAVPSALGTSFLVLERWNRRWEKTMRAAHPHTPRQVRVTCTMILKDGKPVGRGAGAPHLPRSNCVSWACIARNSPPEQSNPLNGKNLIYQVRELRRNSQGHALCPSALEASLLVR